MSKKAQLKEECDFFTYYLTAVGNFKIKNCLSRKDGSLAYKELLNMNMWEKNLWVLLEIFFGHKS